MDQALDWANRHKVALIAAGVVLLLLIVGYSNVNSTRSTAVDKETALTAQYSDNINELSSFLLTVHEQFGIAQSNTAAVDQVLTDAVKGRYQGDTTARPGGGQLFSAIKEAYPDLANVSGVFNRLTDTISSGREAYKQKQSKLLDMLRSYDNFRHGDIIRSLVASLAGVPSHNLRASIGTDSKFGQAAEDRMYSIVLAGDAAKAYTTGTQAPIDLSPSSTTTTSR